jgi:hypothetical protein
MVPCPFGKMMYPVVTTEKNTLSKNNWCDKKCAINWMEYISHNYEFSGHLYVLMRFEIPYFLFSSLHLRSQITAILALGTMQWYHLNDKMKGIF